MGSSILKTWRLKSDDKLLGRARAARSISAELNVHTVHIPGSHDVRLSANERRKVNNIKQCRLICLQGKKLFIYSCL